MTFLPANLLLLETSVLRGVVTVRALIKAHLFTGPNGGFALGSAWTWSALLSLSCSSDGSDSSEHLIRPSDICQKSV